MVYICPDCGGKVSEHASACPSCGCPISFVKMPIEETELLSLRTADVYDIVKFGRYPQDETREKKDIPWIVLEKTNDRILLLSQLAIEAKTFCYSDDCETANNSWSESDVRKWLNGDFLEEAFSEGEQKQIILSKVVAEMNPEYSWIDPGIDTEDRLFLLSTGAVRKYLPNPGMCIAKAAYGVAFNIDESPIGWWLRTKGARDNFVSFVDTSGRIDYEGFMANYFGYGTRPAMWVKLRT